MTKLSKMERITLINQYKILNLLEPDPLYEQHIEVLQNGYINFYSDLFETLQKEVSKDVLRFTNEVLNMYRAMHSYALKHKDFELLERVKFEGFDAESEFEYWQYTEFLIIKLNRFQEIRTNKKDDSFNTHYPISFRYEKQLSAWKSLKGARLEDLKIEDINLILQQ